MMIKNIKVKKHIDNMRWIDIEILADQWELELEIMNELNRLLTP